MHRSSITIDVLKVTISQETINLSTQKYKPKSKLLLMMQNSYKDNTLTIENREIFNTLTKENFYYIRSQETKSIPRKIDI